MEMEAHLPNRLIIRMTNMDNSMQRSVFLTLRLQQPVNTSGEREKHQMDLNTSENWAARQQMKSDMQGYVSDVYVYTL